ncbi:MAG: thiol-disulfide isomerase [Streptococcaceae bacterium]|jgi:lactoylglutathione lyase|nr:thiol-disulfide isomerase [Streptococcaceae bacterium]
MITDMTVMLYVEEVAVSSKFWQNLGFEEVLNQNIGEGHETVLLMYAESGAAIQLYDKEFIRQTQPELLNSNPILLFSADYIDDIYSNLVACDAQVSEIEPYGDQHYFTFLDPDDNRFTLIGDLVDKPATAEDLEEFDRNMHNLLPLSFEDLENMSRPNYIFFGRKTCPWCRRMAKDFKKLDVRMYWVDTEGTDAENPVRRRYNVKEVPTLIKRASNGMFVTFDGKKQSLSRFLGAAK